ncbi:uncharacterized protein PGTG_06726 [Puccinia graminis f. sp. tritici CRL 75-36-700-3]|uniref:Uncharacterized protein n=1 Tax=Puccinia graminis f. sp. tritici (strain CRL 75-36-700-3 / race SCCL) TaxID=418459 RepID=E3K8L9_PUCGT|nr:uncharacterized protein PGTG_06726 [Puccinia graminis f. sp. tritici CRL 75-36-700-3]EFP80770.1 hypothetical protein PGTG_06726 [Puccinia graminis f. sp. tritici CRL 75-36-700-3]
MDGHDLNNSGHVARMIHSHKSTGDKTDKQASLTRSSTKSHFSHQPPAKAGRTSAATLGGAEEENNESDFSGSELEVTAGQAEVSLSSTVFSNPSGNANLESGCSVSMTPDLSAISRAKADSTPVRLADHSLVEATHKGVSKLPLDTDATVTTLVVPDLAEPLLSIAGLCDAGLTVVFTKQSEKI